MFCSKDIQKKWDNGEYDEIILSRKKIEEFFNNFVKANCLQQSIADNALFVIRFIILSHKSHKNFLKEAISQKNTIITLHDTAKKKSNRERVP